MNKFFDEYPESWITIYRMKGEWHAELYTGESVDPWGNEDGSPICGTVGNSPQVALGNLAAKMLRLQPAGLGERIAS